MALDVTTFVAKFPEFDEIGTVSPDTITQAIEDAKEFCDSTIWGSRYESGVLYKAAHMLAMSPFGETARLDKKGEQSTYGVVFDSMRRALPIRMAVT